MRSLIILCSALVISTLLAMVSVKKAAGLSVTSTAFTNNGMIPSKYSCEGAELSPPLSVSNIPAKAQSLALILHDPDADKPGGFTHWVVWNITTDGKLPEGFKGAEQGWNGANQPGYKGMCPPTGTHHYHFRVYALNNKPMLQKNTDKAALEKAIQGHILAEGELVGLYKKVK